jgi:hypothetical protein
MMLLRAQVCALGCSGVRVDPVVELLLAMLERGVPRVPWRRARSGASGDLAPLAHLALALIGEGEARFEGELLPGPRRSRAAGLTPLTSGRERGPRLDQRHPVHDRARRARAVRRGAPGDGGGHRGGDEPRGPEGLEAALRRAPDGSCARTPDRPRSPPTCGPARHRQRDHDQPRATATRCRTRTRSAACPRCTARRATRSRWATRGAHARGQQRDRQPHRAAATKTAAPTSSRAATSTASPSRSPWISRRSPSPSSPTSASGASSSWSTRPSRAGCRRSSRRRAGCTRAS